MKRLLSFWIAALLLLPAMSRADTYDSLQNSAEEFQQRLQHDETQERADQADIKLEGSAELFPGTESESSSSVRPAETSGFVRFMWNGQSYELKDVPIHAWFAPYVRDVADKGVVSGYRNAQGAPTGFFRPERSVSIEELAKMAIEAAGIDESACALPPRNAAAAGGWSASYIACAEQHSFVVYAEGRVDIRRPATRGEVVMTVLQAFGAALVEAPSSDSQLRDVNASTLFAPAIFTALNEGIVSGYSDSAGNPTGEFGPHHPVNRAEMAKIVSLAIQIYGP